MAETTVAPTRTPDQPAARAKPAPRPATARTRLRSPLLTGPPALRLGPVPASGAASGGGEPLSPAVQEPIEQSLGVSLESVRVHTGNHAQSAARDLSARAFTFGNQVFLGPGERPTDLGLMAHEAAHVVQQKQAPAVQRLSSDSGNAFEREAHQASAAVVSQQPFTVRERTTGSRVQRFGISDVLDWFADKANNIPGFRMFTIILGVNPINMSAVDRSAANILRAVIEFIPGGALITQALDNYGIFDKIGNWVEQQIRTLGMVGSAIKQAVSDFIDSLSWSDVFHLGRVWDRAKRIFTDPIDRIINFAKGLVSGIIDFIKDAILRPLAKLAEGTRGYDLLKAILGKDPVTGDPFPRTADTLIGGFMKLIGQEEVWNNLKKANAVARAWAWFQSALATLMGFVSQIPTLFINALKSLELIDIILVPRAFLKVAAVFGSFIGDFISWAGNAVWDLLKIIFEVVAPGAVPYLNKVGAAFKTILKNPIGFVGNLVKAGKLGFQQFADKIGAHLKASFIEWLTGSLSGVYIPKSFDFGEIVKFVLSVLGLTWQNIRGKLVKVVGEPAVKAMEEGFKIVVTLVTEGPAAAWEQIKTQIGNLKDMVMQGIMDFIVDTVVKKAVAKIISFLVPGGAFIQAIITIYDTIMVFISKLQKIIQVAKAFLDSIVAIANGAIGGAANKVETTLAGLLTLAISFLAGFASLGKIADKVMDIINTKVRAPIDKALDFVINWIVTMAKKLFAKVFGKDKKDDRTDAQKQADLEKGTAEADALLANEDLSPEDVKQKLPGIKEKYKLTRLEVVTESKTEAEETDHIEGEVNPKKAAPPKKKVNPSSEYNVGTHVVGRPPTVKKAAGESHHVPYKVLKRWIGEILEIAGAALIKTDNEDKGKAMKAKGTQYKGDDVGTGLSAIWLSSKAHDIAHGAAKPGELTGIEGDFVVKIESGDVSTRPTRGTVARSIQEQVVESSTADTKRKRNKEIYDAKANRLPSFFSSIFDSALSAGIALVERVKLKDDNWKDKLRNLAQSTWKGILKP
jgi:hypothetical protein